MRKQLRFLFICLSLLVLVAFVLFVVNQISGVYMLAREVHPGFGLAVLWTLILLFGALFAIPAVLYFRLPKPLPAPENDEARAVYLQALGKRLSKNKLLRGEKYNWTEETEISRALAVLENRADALVQTTAKSVFLTTAISQNGKLDALTVLVTHTRMIWQVAHIYYQRPALKDIVGLYANVGTTTFLASQIEDIDISHHLEPIMGSVLQNSAVKSVPFLGQISSLVMDSVLEGTINAYLTLRVGVIAKRYCSSMGHFDSRVVRRAAYSEASAMLGNIVRQSSGQVVRSIMQSARQAGSDSVRTGLQVARDASSEVKNDLFGWMSRRRQPRTAGPDPAGTDL
jgi:hypothetical protein